MELVGLVQSIGQEVKVNEFLKRSLIIKTQGEYPQVYCIDFFKDKSVFLNGLNVGDKVRVHCSLNGREWVNPQTSEVKYFLSLSGWKIEKQLYVQVEPQYDYQKLREKFEQSVSVEPLKVDSQEEKFPFPTLENVELVDRKIIEKEVEEEMNKIFNEVPY